MKVFCLHEPNMSVVQTANAKARATQGGRAKEIEEVERVICIYLRVAVLVQHDSIDLNQTCLVMLYERTGIS